MNKIQDLWINKNSSQGRIDITMFFINLFLIICHMFLMIIYIIVNHKFMIIINLISLLIYLSCIFYCYKNQKAYFLIALIEIWIHMLCAIASFGWKPCFQNWSFPLITACFLPIFSIKDNSRFKKQALFFSISIILTYSVTSVLINVVDYNILRPLDDFMNRLLFMVNNLFSFFSIVMLALFYTSTNKNRVRELSRIADFDELTGIYNRHSLYNVSESIVEESKLLQKPYSVAILDIDYFKSVNDTYGHPSGDDVLKQLAGLLKSLEDKDIVVGRWGGEEFVLLAPTNINYSNFKKILESFRIKVSNTIFKIEDNKEINITISIGAKKIRDYKQLDDAVSEADENLYNAKESGRNKLVG